MAEAGNASSLREENLQLHKDNQRVTDDLKAAQKALSDLEAKTFAQAEKDAKTIEDLTKALDRRLEEVAILDNEILGKQALLLPLCSSTAFFLAESHFAFSFADQEDTSVTRINKLKEFSELYLRLRSSAKAFIVKFFPKKKKEYTEAVHILEIGRAHV